MKSWILAGNLIVSLLLSSQCFAGMPESVKALYLPSHKFTKRKIEELVHYAKLAELTGVVLHVKDPRGWLSWDSDNPIALEIGAVKNKGFLIHTIKQLKDKGLWTIAKIDVFADDLLALKHPEMGVINYQTGNLWADKNGLRWVNPYDRRVWDYNIALSKELAALGFDEIQFDYMRFPSDGDLSTIQYPITDKGLTKTKSITAFLETAYRELKPLGVMVSIDVFGLVAWKTTDFGVGQVLEKLAPYADVISPMLYPSHFPAGFMGKENPSKFPGQIMELSIKQMKKRTNKKIRPWVQGFWYKPEEIIAQIEGILSADTSGWAIWNPTGDYKTTYAALAKSMNRDFPEPKFYPSFQELQNKNDKIIPGKAGVINLTKYREGFTIISLERSKKGKQMGYSTPLAVINTIDEGIMDQILKQREIPFSKLTSKYAKKIHIANLLSEDLEISLRSLRPIPIYIDWQNSSRFTQTMPQNRLDIYLKAVKAAFPKTKPATNSSPIQQTPSDLPDAP
ncbi:MAG: putative glycoside hydrolase [Thermodesulfobacteriota bacterium]